MNSTQFKTILNNSGIAANTWMQVTTINGFSLTTDGVYIVNIDNRYKFDTTNDMVLIKYYTRQGSDIIPASDNETDMYLDIRNIEKIMFGQVLR